MKKNIIIAILAIVSIGLIGYIVYDKMNDKKEEPMNNEKEENNNQVDNSLASNYKLEDFTKIIEEELGFLESKKNYKDLTNKEKNHWLYLLSHYPLDLLTTDTLENIRKNSSLREMEVEYDDVYAIYEGYEISDTLERTLDKESGKYTDVLGGHGAISISGTPFLYDFKIDNDQYIISYKYVFIQDVGQGPADLNIHYTYENAVNRENKIKVFSPTETNYDMNLLYMMAKNYIEDNYESFKDKLETYNYVFEIHDGNIVLVDFYRN